MTKTSAGKLCTNVTIVTVQISQQHLIREREINQINSHKGASDGQLITLKLILRPFESTLKQTAGSFLVAQKHICATWCHTGQTNTMNI